MTTRSFRNVLRTVRRTALAQAGAEVADGQLLEAFVVGRDEAAFAALMRRHGAMVMGVCRRVLRNSHDAEDAFQATFLVLVRKAAQIRPTAMVANWLHGVAYRAALKARSVQAKRHRRERPLDTNLEPATKLSDPWDDLRQLIDQELSRLPEKHRLPIILCDLEGKSIKDATRQLGWPQGTLAGRLARGRKLLAQRLTSRGVSVPSCAIVAVLGTESGQASVTASLTASTLKAAVAYVQPPAAIQISGNVAALTEGVLKSMLVNKVKSVVVVPLMLALLGTGIWTTSALFSAPSVDERGDSTPVASASDQQPNAPKVEDLYSKKCFFVETFLIDGNAKGPARRRGPHRILLREGEKLNKFPSWTTFAWSAPNAKAKEADFRYTLNTGFFFEIQVREIAEDSIALYLNIHRNEIDQHDSEGAGVRGSNMEMVRKVKLETLTKIVIEKDAQTQPVSWLEIKIVRDTGKQPSRLRIRADTPPTVSTAAKSGEITPGPKPMPLPKTSRGIPYAVGMEGHWTVTRIEADGESLGDDATNKFGKTLWCTGGFLVTPGRGLFDQGWDMPFELDTSTTPKRITLHAPGVEGPLRFNGIYLMDGTDLKICLNENSRDSRAPQEFKTTKGSPFVLFTCKWAAP